MKKSLRLFLFLLCGVCMSMSAFGQRTVTGTITDENAEPLIGVNIIVQNTSNGTVTDLDGTYSLEVSEGDVLNVSYVGYASQDIEVGTQSVIDISMSSDVAQLDEIVVTGYASQKKSNLTGAVGLVSAKELEARPITNATQALQGKVSGVWINQGSGEPGQDGATIRIRGIGTLNNADPLVLIDGIEAPLGNIDPNDIESLTVLKDAASAAIYGSRAANGVVLVTTKRGTKGAKPQFSYTGFVGTTEVIDIPDYIWDSREFMELRNEADVNSGNPALYSDALVSKYGASSPNTNWFEEMFQKGPIQQHNLSVGGGSESTNFNISLGYLDQEGIVLGAGGSKRYNARINLDTDVNDKFSIGGSFYVSNQESDLDNVDQDGGVLARATRLGPNFPAYDSQGRLADRARDLDAVELSTPNVLAEILAQQRVLSDNRFLGSFYAEYEPIEKLKIRGTFAANQQTDDDEFFNRKIQTFDWETGDPTLAWRENREFRNRHYQSLNITTWLQATYEKTLSEVHNFKFLAGANQESFEEKFFDASRLEIPSNSLPALSTGNPETSTNSGGASEWALRSFFGRVNYDFKDKYLLEMNIRRDGSSRFGRNNRWATFPSVSAGWVISEEDFFNSSLIDFFKVRASWGKLGNQELGSNYPFAASISFTPAYNFGGTIVGAAAQTTLGNPNIRWETTTQTDIGVNMSMLKGRLSFEADYFIRNAEDILFDQSNPGVTGVRNPTTVNIAEVENRGWELFSNYRHKVGKATVTIGGNVTHVVSEVKQIDPTLAGEADRIFQGAFILQRGAPINALYGVEAIGIFQSQAEIDAAPDQSAFGTPTPGDLQYLDENGDGVIDVNDRKVLGQDNPTWIYGFNLGVEAGGFDFAVLFQGIADAQVFETGRIYAPFANSGGVSALWRDRWTPQNTDASLPKIRIPGSINYNVNNSWWISDRSHLRLKNLQIGYNLPSSMLENNFIRSLRIFVNGTNLWTSSDYVGFDPERPPRATNAFSGYPQLKLYTAGVSLKF